MANRYREEEKQEKELNSEENSDIQEEVKRRKC